MVISHDDLMVFQKTLNMHVVDLEIVLYLQGISSK